MKRLLYLLLIFCVTFLRVDQLKGKHIIGGEIYYECLGFTNNDPTSNSRTYQIYMRMYRDCLGGGADFDSAPGATVTASVTIYRGVGGTLLPVQYLSEPSRVQIDPNPGNVCVKTPPNLCIEEGLYEFRTIDLPISSESYFIVYQRCCRNQDITNISNPGFAGATYFVEITPQAQQICNSSPVFDNIPPFVLCAGESFSIGNAATDADGHQLRYAFCSPFLGGGIDNQNPADPTGIAPDPDAAPPYAEVDFIQPLYSAQQPLGDAADFRIDSLTGRLTGTPTVKGQFVVGVCVSEFAPDGTLLSIVRRDLQFLVTDCELNIQVNIGSDSVDASGRYLVGRCGEGALTIENNSTQDSFLQDFRWEFEENGTIRTFTEWSPEVRFTQTGIYNGRLILTSTTGCIDTGFVEVAVRPKVTADFTVEGDVCSDAALQFQNNSVIPAGIDPLWEWEFGDGAIASAFSPAHQFSEAGSRIVRLIAQTPGNCRDTFERQVDYFPLPPDIGIQLSEVEGCIPQDISFGLDLAALNEQYDILWDFGDGGTRTEASGQYQYVVPGAFSIRVSVEAPNGCRIDSLVQPPIVVEEAPMAAFTFAPAQPTSVDPRVVFSDRSQRAGEWLWDFGGLGSSTEPDPVFTFPDSGTHVVRLIVTHNSGCTDTTLQTILIRASKAIYVPNAFSPNNDGLNDEFRSFGPTSGRTNFELSVWARWGEQVFYSNDPAQGWNGLLNNFGEPLPSGTYIYTITFEDADGDRFRKSGTVSLLR